MSPLINIPKDSFYSAMRQSLKAPGLINPYQPNKYINFKSRFAGALLNQPGTHTAKALLRAGVIVNPSFTMTGLIHARYFKSINRFSGLLSQSLSGRQYNFATTLQRLQPLLNPERVRFATYLAETAALTVAPADVLLLPKLDCNSIHDIKAKKVAVENYVKDAERILEHESATPENDWFEKVYPIPQLNLWERVNDKTGASIILMDIIFSLLSRLVVESDMETIKKLGEIIHILLLSYIAVKGFCYAGDKACEEKRL